MSFRRMILVVVACAALTDAAIAQQVAAHSPAAAARLRGLSAAEADALIEVLKDAQQRLSNGETARFTLLSGAAASHQMAQVTPRQAFIDIDFEHASYIERGQTTSGLWQPYTLLVGLYAPGQMIWNVEVMIGRRGNLERVEMVYQLPPLV